MIWMRMDGYDLSRGERQMKLFESELHEANHMCGSHVDS